MSKTIYKLYDYYEGKQKIGEYDNWHDLQKAKKEWIADTDGECDLAVEEYDIWEKENSLEELEKLMIENADVLKRLKECWQWLIHKFLILGANSLPKNIIAVPTKMATTLATMGACAIDVAPMKQQQSLE